MACTVRARDGRLRYRVYWEGYESQERTGLRDTPANRQKLLRKAAVMSDEIAEGRFDYLRWFPKGSKAHLFGATRGTPTALVGTYATGTWLPRKQPPLVRAVTLATYKKHLSKHILPVFQGRRFAEVTPTALEDFRARLIKPEAEGGKELAVKSARDIIDGTFRALYRDARREGLATGDPFADLVWPRKVVPEPDPFTPEERDKLCAYFAERDRFWYPLVFARFWTGVRPSEVRGFRRGDWSAREGKLRIRVSRTLREDNAPKTTKSARTITVVAAVRDALSNRPAPLVVRPDDFLFTTPTGKPLDEDRFVAQHWHRALTATKIRPRKFHATRHTFISCALTQGTNLKWLADYTGTSVEMIEKHYGRWLSSDDAQLDLLTAANDDGSKAGRKPDAA